VKEAQRELVWYGLWLKTEAVEGRTKRRTVYAITLPVPNPPSDRYQPSPAWTDPDWLPSSQRKSNGKVRLPRNGEVHLPPNGEVDLPGNGEGALARNYVVRTTNVNNEKELGKGNPSSFSQSDRQERIQNHRSLLESLRTSQNAEAAFGGISRSLAAHLFITV